MITKIKADEERLEEIEDIGLIDENGFISKIKAEIERAEKKLYPKYYQIEVDALNKCLKWAEEEKAKNDKEKEELEMKTKEIFKQEIQEGCKGTSANCYNIYQKMKPRLEKEFHGGDNDRCDTCGEDHDSQMKDNSQQENSKDEMSVAESSGVCSQTAGGGNPKCNCDLNKPFPCEDCTNSEEDKCKCSLCLTFHYCPDGCAMHPDYNKGGDCVCNKCFLKYKGIEKWFNGEKNDG